MAPIINFATSSGSKEKEPRYACQKTKPSKSPVREPPLQVPPTVSLWRRMLCLQSQWFIHSFISVRVPKKEPSYEMREKHTVTIHRAPCGQRAYIQWGVAWLPKGIVYDTAITTQCRAAFSTIHSTLAWVGHSPLASVCHSNPQQGILPHLLPSSTRSRVK